MTHSPVPFILPRAGRSFRGLLSALPDFALGGAFLVTWISPLASGQDKVGYLTLVVLLEFVTIHSSAFAGALMFWEGDRGRKILLLLGLGAFYSLVVGGISRAFEVWWPFAAFWGLMLNRLLGVLLGQAPAGQERSFVQSAWVAALLLYVVFAFLTVLLPIPPLGATSKALGGQKLPGGALWADEPHRLLALGFLYFTGLGISEVFGHAWLGRRAKDWRA